jgi:TatD DNase family protein
LVFYIFFGMDPEKDFLGVITYATNANTSNVIRNMTSPSTPPSTDSQSPPPAATPDPSSLRILLETDAPYMVPSNLYNDLPAIRGKKLPVCHSAMVPWTADFVAGIANGSSGSSDQPGGPWSADEVMKIARENARKVYGV